MTALEEYGTQILDGKIVACRKIKKIYEKLLDKLYHPDQFHFDGQEAKRHIDFIEKFCKQSQGEIGKPIVLEPFQKAILEAIFGFRDDNDLREYNEALLCIGRKNGKTTLLSAVSLDLLVNDREGAPEIYFIATKRDQAKKGFDEAVRMMKQSPDLSANLRKRVSDIYFPLNEGIIQALASNSNSLDGLNGSGIIIDELSAIKNRDIYDLMKQSMSARRQGLLFQITTNGFLRNGIFDAQYEYASKIIEGEIDDQRFLPMIYELDDRSEWTDPKMWIKANPSLGKIKSYDFLNECVEKAKKDEAFRPTVLVKDFNIKENSSTAWLNWEEIENEEISDIKFRYCIGGFDSADSVDLNSAKAIFVRPNDPKIYTRSMYWIPETVLDRVGETGLRQERDKAPYDLWVKQGLMRTCSGGKCSKDIFLEWFIELRETEGIYPLYIGYDPWHIDDSLLARFKGEFGQNSMIPIRQGSATLSRPMQDFRAELREHNIVYDNNPIDKWCLMNTEIRADINGNIQPVKALDKTKRIDGTVSWLCAYKVLQDRRQEIENLNYGATNGNI